MPEVKGELTASQIRLFDELSAQKNLETNARWKLRSTSMQTPATASVKNLPSYGVSSGRC